MLARDSVYAMMVLEMFCHFSYGSHTRTNPDGTLETVDGLGMPNFIGKAHWDLWAVHMGDPTKQLDAKSHASRLFGAHKLVELVSLCVMHQGRKSGVR